LYQKSSFEINGVLKEDLLYLGNEISMMDNGGNTVLGKVIEIVPDGVKMDFNHNLADKSLFVTGKVHEVRNVTETTSLHLEVVVQVVDAVVTMKYNLIRAAHRIMNMSMLMKMIAQRVTTQLIYVAKDMETADVPNLKFIRYWITFCYPNTIKKKI